MHACVGLNSTYTITSLPCMHRNRPCLRSLYSPLRSPKLGDKPHRPRSVAGILENYGLELFAQHPGWTTGLLVNTVVYIFGIRLLLNGLTWAGVLHSWFLGCSIYSAFGLRGYLLVALYFVVGSRVTKIRLEQKKAEGIAEKRSGRRSIGGVWGSGFAGAGCALLSLITGNYRLFQIGFVASFGSKLSDTVSSEIGKAYGKTTFLITTFEQCPRGTEGAISVEGTFAGLATALVYSLLAFGFQQVSLVGAGIVFAACVVSNFVESYIGASIQGKVPWLTNHVVNIIQITMAAVLAIILKHYLLS